MYPYQLLSIYQSYHESDQAFKLQLQNRIHIGQPPLPIYLPKLGSLQSSLPLPNTDYGIPTMYRYDTSYLYEPVQSTEYLTGGTTVLGNVLGYVDYILRMYVHICTSIVHHRNMTATTHVCPTSKVP